MNNKNQTYNIENVNSDIKIMRIFLAYDEFTHVYNKFSSIKKNDLIIKVFI